MRGGLLFTKVALTIVVMLILAGLGCSSPASSIIFTSDRDGNLEIYSVNANGEKLTNLTNTRTDEFTPVVSPNRRLVSFLSGVPGDTDTAVEVMRIDGTERSRLTQSSAVVTESASWNWRSNECSGYTALFDHNLIVLELCYPVPVLNLCSSQPSKFLGLSLCVRSQRNINQRWPIHL